MLNKIIFIGIVVAIVSLVKSIVLRVKTSVSRVKHYINDPFGHTLQTTLINVTTFNAHNKRFYA